MSKNILSPEMGVLYPGRTVIATRPTSDTLLAYHVDEIRNMGGVVTVNHCAKLPQDDEFTFPEQLSLALNALGVKSAHFRQVIHPRLREELFSGHKDVERAYQTACDKLDLPEADNFDPRPIRRLFDLGVYVVKKRIELTDPLSEAAYGYVNRLSGGETAQAMMASAEGYTDSIGIKSALAHARTALQAERNDKLLIFNAHLAGVLPLENPSPTPPAA
ncbi:MAG TPA: hypothetical protein VLG11_01885 [Candidatus Saccharimonadales bacterium]|nr:hypothetical protein [Candidatus Saccharimonadales bacterium]